MIFSARIIVIILLTVHLPNLLSNSIKPLTPTEWKRFIIWLDAYGYILEDLLTSNLTEILKNFTDLTITVERILALLNRYNKFLILIKKWLSLNLWILINIDEDYPEYLKQKLKQNAPVLLFGCGNRKLLNQSRKRLAILGSRKVEIGDLDYANQLGFQAAKNEIAIISGCAAGIDEAAMFGALKTEGVVIGVLADNLLKKSVDQKYNLFLKNENLVLISPYNPEIGFQIGNAMQRNKYIYCLSDAGFIVHSGLKKGGTWAGATENLKQGWVPLWVKPNSDDNMAGNSYLLKNGALLAPNEINDINFIKLFK